MEKIEGCNWGMQVIDGCSLKLCAATQWHTILQYNTVIQYCNTIYSAQVSSYDESLAKSGVVPQKSNQLHDSSVMVPLQRISLHSHNYRVVAVLYFFIVQIPFFPLVKKDLTFIHFGNDSRVDGLVNFDKLRMIAKEIRHVSQMANRMHLSVSVVSTVDIKISFAQNSCVEIKN